MKTWQPGAGRSITLGLILLNFLFSLVLTKQWRAGGASPVREGARSGARAQHPELTVPPPAQQLVTDFRRYYPANWAEMQNPNNEANEVRTPR